MKDFFLRSHILFWWWRVSLRLHISWRRWIRWRRQSICDELAVVMLKNDHALRTNLSIQLNENFNRTQFKYAGELASWIRKCIEIVNGPMRWHFSWSKECPRTPASDHFRGFVGSALEPTHWHAYDLKYGQVFLLQLIKFVLVN